MRFGTYYFLQAPPSVTHPDVIRQEVEQMVWTEELGFDSIWLTEHHFIDYGLSVSPAVLAAAAAMRTRRVRIGLAAAILPFHDPVRLAEELAMVDILSEGRLDVGAGRGARRRDVVPGGAAPLPAPRTDGPRTSAVAAGLPGHGRAVRDDHLGAARRRNPGRRLARHRDRPDRGVPASGRRRGAVLDELRRLASGARATLHGALRPRGHAAVPVAAVTSSFRSDPPRPRRASTRPRAPSGASEIPATRRAAFPPRRSGCPPGPCRARTSSAGSGTSPAPATEALRRRSRRSTCGSPARTSAGAERGRRPGSRCICARSSGPVRAPVAG